MQLISVILLCLLPTLVQGRDRPCIEMSHSHAQVERRGVDKRFPNLRSYEVEEWRQMLAHVFKYGDLAASFTTSLINVIRNMPEELQRQLDSMIAAAYPTLSKYGPRDDAHELGLPPKRAIDAFISIARKPVRYFRSSEESPAEKLNYYLEQQNRQLFANSEFGGYSGQAVVEVAKIVQAEMQRAAAAPGDTILLYGSFPNGRANLSSSDIDSLVSSDRLLDYYPQMNQLIRMRLTQLGYENSLELEPPQTNSEYRRPEKAADFSKLTPVQVLITPNSIELHVYPSFIVTDVEVLYGMWKRPPKPWVGSLD